MAKISLFAIGELVLCLISNWFVRCVSSSNAGRDVFWFSKEVLGTGVKSLDFEARQQHALIGGIGAGLQQFEIIAPI